MTDIYNFELKTIEGTTLSLEEYKDKTLLIVNVASKCGFTSQYKELEELYQKYSEKNLVILGFPCNQFGFQEFENNEDIMEFCKLNYNVTFPMFSKIEVNGKDQEPLYKYLKKEQAGLLGSKDIKWNFTKFLVNKKGEVIERFAPAVAPLSFEKTILEIL